MNGAREAARLPLSPRVWRLYRPAVGLIALVSTAIIALSGGFSNLDWYSLAVLILLANMADLAAVQIQKGMRVSTAHFAAPFAVVAGPAGGGIVAAMGCLAGRLFFNRRDWNLFDLAVNLTATSASAAVWALWRLGDSTRLSIVGYAMAIVTYAVVRALLNHGWALETRSRGIAIPMVSADIGKLMLACALLFTPAVALVLEHGHPLAWTMLVLPFAATHLLFRAFARERELSRSLENANVSLAESLVTALDARDPYSAGHSLAVAVYSRDIAVEIGLEPYAVQRIYLAGLLHDIGKIAVADSVLLKPSALSDREFAEIQRHPVIGEQILAPSEHFADILPGVRNHHERFDGGGYPDGMSEEDIPLQARIIAVADAYNAMTSQRPYRDAMQPSLACRIMVQNQGLQHDPFIVAAFQRILAARGGDYAVGHGPEFAMTRTVQELLERYTVPGVAVNAS